MPSDPSSKNEKSSSVSPTTTGRRDNLYTQIGGPFVEAAITLFYQRAFVDPIIGHFFFNKNIDDITAKQIDFASAMLGGPRNYRGKSLEAAHAELKLRPPHFGRRQVLMRQVLEELGLASELIDSWMEMEEDLRPLIFRSRATRV